MTEFEDRLFKAYFRRFGRNAPCPSSTVEYVEHDGKTYAVLSNINDVLAVYRVKDDGSLKYVKNLRGWKNEWWQSY